MDPLTHCLIGGMSAKAVRANPRRFWIMTLLGMFPDLDVLANFLGSGAYLFQHRGLSHSLAGLVVQPLFLALLLGRWDKGSFKVRAWHYSLPIGLHLICDLLTSYGVPLLSPFNLNNYSWNLTGSLNIVPLMLTLFGLVWLHYRKLSGWKATMPVWLVWVLYISFVFTGKAYASLLTVPTHSHVRVTPTVMNPFSWNAVALNETENVYDQYTVDLLTGHVSRLGKWARPGREFPVQVSLKSPEVQNFLATSRWPMVRVRQEGAQTRVEWGQIIFSVKGMVRGHVAVLVSADGQILNEDKIITFWNPKLN